VSVLSVLKGRLCKKVKSKHGKYLHVQSCRRSSYCCIVDNSFYCYLWTHTYL